MSGVVVAECVWSNSMKVFICWSGDVSKELAEAIHNWLRNVIQSIEPYFSSADLEKGAPTGSRTAG